MHNCKALSNKYLSKVSAKTILKNQPYLSIKKPNRGYVTMSPEDYLMNKRASNASSKIHRDSLFPLNHASTYPKNLSKPKNRPRRRSWRWNRALRSSKGHWHKPPKRPRCLYQRTSPKRAWPNIRPSKPLQFYGKTTILIPQMRS